MKKIIFLQIQNRETTSSRIISSLSLQINPPQSASEHNHFYLPSLCSVTEASDPCRWQRSCRARSHDDSSTSAREGRQRAGRRCKQSFHCCSQRRRRVLCCSQRRRRGYWPKRGREGRRKGHSIVRWRRVRVEGGREGSLNKTQLFSIENVLK